MQDDAKPAIGTFATSVEGLTPTQEIGSAHIGSTSPSAQLVGLKSPLVRAVEITKRFEFSAAHQLPKHPGKCKRLHGHNYVVEVTMQGDVNPRTGMVEDFDRLKQHCKLLIDDIVDHYFLNDIYPEMETTAENLAVIWLTMLRNRDSRYARVKVWETSDSSATAYR